MVPCPNRRDMLAVGDFLAHIAPLSGHDPLSPAEASQLHVKIIELLLDNTVDFSLLKFLSRFWTPDSYDELVEERNIEHQCGYPVCRQLPELRVRRPLHGDSKRYQIYLRKPLMILPNTFSLQYCCKLHYQALLFYRNQLLAEAVFARKEIMVQPPFPDLAGFFENGISCLEEVLAKHREMKSQGKTLAEVIALMNGLSVLDEGDTLELVQMIHDFEIIEHLTETA